EDDFAYFVDEHASAGFSGGLNWYRSVDHTWATNAPWADRPVTVPSLFIAGEHDCVLQMRGEGALDVMRANVADLRGVHIVPGEGHTVQLEAPDAVNRCLLDFLATLM
ncbi:MAG TPA: alpha/beta hydrolase, partial [Ilumatobacteraceae bacterium]|nr:alpha/beta hydrolase [Ilumatobacteraceae bacterium]